MDKEKLKQVDKILYSNRVIDNRNLKMTDTLKSLLSREEYRTLDVAVGYFYISGLLLIKDEFTDFMDKRNGHFRILMGNETNGSTVNILDGSKYQDYSGLIKEKTSQDTSKISDVEFLSKINEWINNGQMEVKVYVGDANYFHAKSYLFASTLDAQHGTAIVGSSNFSKAGLEGNTELNVLSEDGYLALHRWYSDLWTSPDEVKDFSPDLINIVKANGAKTTKQEYKSVKETYYDFANLYGKPYTKLDETQDWVKDLFAHQRSGVIKIKEKLDSFGTAVLADGVGLGKTRTAAGVIRLYLQSEAVNNILVVADTKLEDQWKTELQAVGINPSQYTYVSRQKLLQFPTDDLIKANYTLVVIDEAHLGFKNNNTEVYRKVAAIKQGTPNIKGLMLTATPWNNTRNDVLNIGSLFLNVDQIPQDRRYKQYYLLSPKKITNKVINHLSADDDAFREFWNDIYLQRTRKTYGGKGAYFPHRNFPSVDIPYEPRKNKIFSDNFDIIADLKFPYQDPIKYIDDSKEELGAKQLKMMLLKRADSSWKAFEISLENIMKKLKSLRGAFLDSAQYLQGKKLVKRYQEFLGTSYDIVEYEDKNNLGLFADFHQDEADDDSNQTASSKIKKKRYIEKLKTQIDDIDLKTAKKAIAKMTADCNSDLETLQLLVNNLKKAYGKIDEKVDKIIECIEDERSKKHKVLLVSQFADTVEYYYDILYKRYNSKRITFPMGMITGTSSSSNKNQGSKINDAPTSKNNVLNHFAPVAKKMPELIADNTEIDLVVGTDTISTGQNLQDAVTLMNIDLPYNPMILEQRIGRIDRPMPAGSKDRQIYIYTFPIYESINSQLKMTSRLQKKMNGVLEDTEFDTVVLPGYQDYLKNIKAKKHNAVQSMLDKTEEDENKFNAVASEEHSAAYEQANERMYNFKTNKFKPVKDPIVSNYSFSNGNSESIAVIMLQYFDINGALLGKENVIVNIDKQKESKVLDAEKNLNEEISHDIHNTQQLSKDKALLLVQQAKDSIKQVVKQKVNEYNKQREFFKENTKTLNNSVSEAAANALQNSAREQPKVVMQALESVNVPANQLMNIVKYIATIDKDDDLFEMVKEIKNDPGKFWLDIKDYIEFFSPDKIREAESIGNNIKQVNTRQANIDKTIFNTLTGNIVSK